MDMTFRTPIVRHLIFRDLYINKKTFLILGGVLIGMLTLFGCMALLDNSNADPNWIWPLVYLTGAFIKIILIFNSVNDAGDLLGEFIWAITRRLPNN